MTDEFSVDGRPISEEEFRRRLRAADGGDVLARWNVERSRMLRMAENKAEVTNHTAVGHTAVGYHALANVERGYDNCAFGLAAVRRSWWQRAADWIARCLSR